MRVQLHHTVAVAFVILATLVVSGCGCSGSSPQTAPPAPIARDVDWKTASNEAWAERITQEWTAAPCRVLDKVVAQELGSEDVVGCQRMDGTVRVIRAMYPSNHRMILEKRSQAFELDVSGRYKVFYADAHSTEHTIKESVRLILISSIKPKEPRAMTEYQKRREIASPSSDIHVLDRELTKSSIHVVPLEHLRETVGDPPPQP